MQNTLNLLIQNKFSVINARKNNILDWELRENFMKGLPVRQVWKMDRNLMKVVQNHTRQKTP